LSLIFDKISASYHQSLPFVCFKKPKASKLKAYFGENNSLSYSASFKDEGFLFAPFNNEKASIIFFKDEFQVIEEPYVESTVNFSKKKFDTHLNDKKNHLELVSSGIDAIKKNSFKKVVLSRKENIKLTSFNLIEVFERLLQKHNNAFVYVWFHPKVGLWMGATPERLVNIKNREFHTTALASTQSYNGDLKPLWGAKEKKEHQYVIDYIVSQIKDQENGIILKNFSVSETYTIKAGNLLHLKADIRGEIEIFELKKLLTTLHPTPAVCGLPKEAAKSFILQNEKYDRAYYTGFLGEINDNSVTELFVNLRCVEIEKNLAKIYVGGGITEESDPEKEWFETYLKTKTIGSIL
jgi:isochorismate synthase